MSAAASQRPPRVPKFPAPSVVDSPALAQLRVALQRGEVQALRRFWAQVAAAGTPLVEPAEGRPGHRVVTFLWRGGDELRAVVLLANKLTDPSVWPQSTMERLAGTDVWHRSYLLRADWRATYQIAALPVADEGVAPPAAGPPSRWGAAAAYAVADPHNPRTFPARDGAEPLSVVELPDAPPQPWCAPRPDVARGTLDEHWIASHRLGNERRAWVYAPPATAARDGGPLDVLVLLDGEDWSGRLPGRVVLDNLIADGAIPPTVAVMPEALDRETRWRELAGHEPFVAFLVDELLPWVGRRLPITADPARTTIAGRSLGGLTALFATLRAPRRFGRALVQSASLWWPSGSEFDADAGRLIDEARTAPQVPARCYLEVGLQEWALLGHHRHLRDVLELRGCAVTYAEYHGGHDALCWQGGLADGLAALSAAPVSGRRPG
ncbi:MAG: enterochelin esterase [Solirubrobacteraceae bacterium]